ncbi:bifunctional DNA-formamidopyrimidine glycosylase/DNA-(apurinic or apyrimidinic site) lyase [Marinicella sp. W31]|uniref:bifunctional DNA-formamidopyrimidine glycosylase/DNA-(apurinic or apyrimidinic site) lyase n=1 Tax=Marinicella sp. W31 TaxID=3023713 RepID=UPI0037564110
MPELPEVETTLRGIEPHVKGLTLKQVHVRQPQLRWPIPVSEIEQLLGRPVQRLKRRGKYILMYFDNGIYLLWHLGMSGSLRITHPDQALRKHDHVELIFDATTSLRFHDPRRFGCLLLAQADEQHTLLEHLGPEPLQEGFDGKYLKKKAQGRKVAVKNFIMNSQIVVGLGNIYASEALFMAGIHPLRKAHAVSQQRYQVLAEKIKQVLSAAIRQGGTTLNDFVDPKGQPGYFEQQLLTYGRAGQPCKNCDAGVIKQVTIGQRSSFYCPECQS